MTLKNMNDLRKRFSVSVVIGLLVTFLILFSHTTIVSLLLFLSVAALSAIGIWEYVQLAHAKEIKPNLSLMLVFSFCMVLAFYLTEKWINFPHLPMLLLLFGMFVSFITHFKAPQHAIVRVAMEVFGVVYIAIPLSMLFGVIYPSPKGFLIPQDGRWWFFYLILVTKVTDIGAFFVGRIWGKNPLASFISPKKTIEGAFAGFICAVITSVIFHFLGKLLSNGSFSLSLVQSLIFGSLLGFLGQVGDLAESLLKRDAVVKDSNRLPGLGGVLDMVDSLLFNAPVLYFFLTSPK